MSPDLYYDDTNGIIDSNITIEINGAKCVLTCVDGKIHAEGDMDVGAQGLFEQVCEMWNTRTPQWQPIESINDQKKDRYYLFGGYDVYGNWVSNKFHFSLNGFINGWCMLTVKNNGITHWMPLPTPPKEQP